MLEAGYLRLREVVVKRVAVVKVGVNDDNVDGTGCCLVEVSAGIVKLTNTIIAGLKCTFSAATMEVATAT